MACTPLYTVTPTPDNSAPGTTQPVPTGIVNGQTVLLTGGVVHSGTLAISGLLNVEIKQTGAGVAVIRPAAGSNGINATACVNCAIGTISSTGSNGIKILSAVRAIDLTNASACTVSRVDAFNCNGSYIYAMSNTKFCTIQRCYIESSSAIAVIGGAGTANNNTYTENTVRYNKLAANSRGMGIHIPTGSSNAITSNLVEHTAYMGIDVLAPFHARISCNTVNDAPNGTDADSGAIYTQFVGSTGTPGIVVDCIISSNTVTGGIGHGIYLDDQSVDITVQQNTIRSCTAGDAINFHRAYRVNVISNSCVDCNIGIGFSGATGEIHDNTVTDNILRNFTSQVFNYQTGQDWRSMGAFTNNAYFTGGTFARVFTGGAADNYTYAQWKALMTAQDATSTFNVTVGTRVVVGNSSPPPPPPPSGTGGNRRLGKKKP